MSLNWKEIDIILAELDLADSHIQQIFQRDYRNIYLQIFKPGRTFILRICLEQGKTRLHESRRKPGSRGNQPRFSEFLRARIRGGKILSAAQHESDRIIELQISRGGEISRMFIKLWSNASNIILCEEDMTVLDAAYRRPNRGESIGDSFSLPSGINDPEKLEKVQSIEPRPARSGMSYGESIAAEYAAMERAEERRRLARELKRYYSMKESSLSARLLRIAKAETAAEGADALQHKGELILAFIWKIKPGDRSVELEDYEQDSRTVIIDLDPSLNPSDNAEKYFDNARKLRSRREHLNDEKDNVSHSLDQVRATLEEIEGCAEEDGDIIRLRELSSQTAEEHRSSRGQDEKAGAPGLEFHSHGFRILVGRNARENDGLLRRHTRGNDTWLHTRDYPGGYVFIKTRPGKSIPLDVLLDAGNLALHFSKARNNGQADMYYTQVKYLRRPKQGKTGLVLPTQEKNLFIKADEKRLSRLLKGAPE